MQRKMAASLLTPHLHRARLLLRCVPSTYTNRSTLSNNKKGVVLGVYDTESSKEALTDATDFFNKYTSGRLVDIIEKSGGLPKKGKSRLFYGLDQEYAGVVVVGIGGRATNSVDEKESVRAAIAGGARQLRDSAQVKLIEVDHCNHSTAAAEGAALGLFSYDDLKQESRRKPSTQLSLYNYQGCNDLHQLGWDRGICLAECQNFARHLMETPANIMTPLQFTEDAGKRIKMLSNDVNIMAWSKEWIESKKMAAFLGIAKGSSQPPVFLEIKYNGAENKEENPLILVGKGVTFDSGGISIKPAANMDLMRGDMGGAAVVVSAILGIVALKLPINVVGLIPLCENLINGSAIKPGDVVTAVNGKTIQVDNTDAEGRLLLADALCYACTTYQPKALINAATLTGGIDVALGSAFTGLFTNSDQLWAGLQQAGEESGDRMWRMPLVEHYTKQVTDSHLADLGNVGKYGRSASACTAAAFLKEFVTVDNWAHLDIAGVMQSKGEIPYLGKGMTGRPTRALIEYATKSSL